MKSSIKHYDSRCSGQTRNSHWSGQTRTVTGQVRREQLLVRSDENNYRSGQSDEEQLLVRSDEEQSVVRLIVLNIFLKFRTTLKETTCFHRLMSSQIDSSLPHRLTNIIPGSLDMDIQN